MLRSLPRLLCALALAGCVGPNYSLRRSAERGDLAGVTKALKRGAKVDSGAFFENFFPDRALIGAAFSGRAEVVSLLLERGADPDIRSVGIGLTPLMIAASRGRLDLMRALLDRGADVNGTDRDGGTPILSVSASTTAASFLIERGADVNAPAKDGQTALMAAVYWARIDLIRLLLDAGADIDAKTKKGHTALYDAARSDDPRVVRLLLERGADPSLLSMRRMQELNCNDAAFRRYETCSAWRTAFNASPDAKTAVMAFLRGREERPR